MKKIFFCSLLCTIVILSKAQKVPVRTSDPVPARAAVTATLPVKSGGAVARSAAVAKPFASLRNSDGGSAGKATQTQTAPHPAPGQTNTGNSRPLLPSEVPTKAVLQRQ